MKKKMMMMKGMILEIKCMFSFDYTVFFAIITVIIRIRILCAISSELELNSMNGFNQVNYRRCKKLCFGETVEQAEFLDDLDAVICGRCFLVHKDSHEDHQCADPVDRVYSIIPFYKYVFNLPTFQVFIAASSTLCYYVYYFLVRILSMSRIDLIHYTSENNTTFCMVLTWKKLGNLTSTDWGYVINVTRCIENLRCWMLMNIICALWKIFDYYSYILFQVFRLYNKEAYKLHPIYVCVVCSINILTGIMC